MRPSRLSLTFLGTFAVTILLLQWWQTATYPAELWIVIGGMTVVAGILCLSALRNGGWFSIAGLAGVAIAFAAVARTTHVPSPNTIDWYANGETATITGTIADDPDARPAETKYTITVDTMVTADGTVQRGLRGRTLVTDRSRGAAYRFGDRIVARGKLKRPEPFDSFRYDHYLSRFGIESILESKSLVLIEKPNLGALQSVRKNLYALKDIIESRLNVLLPEPHASFMAGLLTGSRRGIPKDLTADFQATGLTHIIAISGFNITIVVALIMSFLFWLPIRMRLLPAFCAIALFTVFVGAGAAVVRAAIMGCMGILAICLGRERDVRLALWWTLAIMLFWNPKYLWYDAGFQLSFLSVTGLIELSPYLERHLRRVPEVLGIRESLQATIAAQIATLPLSIALFGRLSLVAPLANILVAPFIPLSMLLGTIGVIVSVVSMPLGRLIAIGGWICLEWIILVTQTLASIPFSSMQIHQ